VSKFKFTVGALTARVWLDELPAHAKLGCETTAEGKSFDARPNGSAEREMAAEAFVNSDPKFHYVLLGGRFVPGGTDFRIQACSQSYSRPGPDWTLHPFTEQFPVEVGLSEWAAQEVARTPLDGLEAMLPAGTLRITHALEHRIDISPYIIWIVTRFLIRVAIDQRTSSVDDLASILRAERAEVRDWISRERS
jgi:hypothetical protein